MKRIFELTTKDIQNLGRLELKEIIKQSEGRTVMAETIVAYPSYIREVSNLELAASFGADLITLNTFNCEEPFIFGMNQDIDLVKGIDKAAIKIQKEIRDNLETGQCITKAKELVGRLIGISLEPDGQHCTCERGYRINRANLETVRDYGFDYVIVAGDTSASLADDDLLRSVGLAREVLGENVLILSGRMHDAHSDTIHNTEMIKKLVSYGADGILFPGPGTVPGFDVSLAKQMVDTIHQEGALAMTTIGTSQEGSSEAIIEQLALMSKMAGADIQHIGDCGTFGMALPENIQTLSVAIRGVRHTYRRMAQSINR